MADHPVPIEDLPNIDPASLRPIDVAALAGPGALAHPPRILMLYGSLRTRSYSRFASEEAARLLRWFGAETRAFNPSGLPLPDAEDPDHPMGSGQLSVNQDETELLVRVAGRA